MWSFFWGTVIVGFLNWIYAVIVKDEVSTLDTIALVYSIILFIILCFCKPAEPKPIEILPIRDPMEN